MNKLAIFVLTSFIINVFGVSHLIKLFISFSINVNEMHKHNEIHNAKLKSLKQRNSADNFLFLSVFFVSSI